MVKWKSGIAILMSLGLLIYALPRLEMGEGWTLPTVFGLVWIGMILLILSAHLYQLLLADQETKEELERVRKYKQLQNRRWLEHKLEKAQSRNQ